MTMMMMQLNDQTNNNDNDSKQRNAIGGLAAVNNGTGQLNTGHGSGANNGFGGFSLTLGASGCARGCHNGHWDLYGDYDTRGVGQPEKP